MHSEAAPNIDWRLGTTGFSDPDWVGPFYPPSLEPAERLSFYSRYFNAVELDTTFYSAPNAARVRKWSAAVPDDFRFALKTPRAITHELSSPHAADAMRAFLDPLHEMGHKLGAVLLQFPPSFTFDSAAVLERFLDALPPAPPIAVELRNSTWGKRRTLDLLSSRGRCLALAEYVSRPARLFATTDFLYVRWIGDHGRFETHRAEQVDVSPSLSWWKQSLDAIQPRPRTIFGFFNNDYSGYSFGALARFSEMIGRRVPMPTGDEQPTLFG